MSREQWGHGYYKGYKDGEKGSKEEKYVCMMDDKGKLCNAYRIIEKHGEIYTLESLWDVVMVIYCCGNIYCFDEDDDEYQDTDILEMNIDTINNYHPHLFYSQKAFLSFIRNNLSKINVEVES